MPSWRSGNEWRKEDANRAEVEVAMTNDDCCEVPQCGRKARTMYDEFRICGLCWQRDWDDEIDLDKIFKAERERVAKGGP